MITKLFSNAHVLFQQTDDNGFNEVAIGASVGGGGMIILEQEGRHIVIDRASVNELCRLLRTLRDAGQSE
jgi:hypothetical protein